MTRRWSVDLLFGNLGRAPHRELVEASQRSLHARAQELLRDGATDDRPVIIGLVELNEGDRHYDDWAILTSIWLAAPTIWAALHRGAREALIYATNRSELVSSRTRRAGRAVKRQSPPRPVHIDRFEPAHPGDPGLTVLLWHSAAGAYNGDRPVLVRSVLRLSWWATRRMARAAAARARRRGDHVVYLADVNTRSWKPLTRHQVEQVQHGPDVIGVIPAPGWAATLRRQPDVRTYIEPGLHPGLAARATFTRQPDRKETR